MRPELLIGAAVAVLAFAGCGDDGGKRGTAPEQVRLEISAPADTAVVDGSTVDVRGRVTPSGARVRVLGRLAQVTGGTFTAVVPLAEGANVIDVAATARGRSASVTALRVTRDERVTVPALDGVVAGELEDELEPLGLRVEAERGGGLLDELLPGEPVVCQQEPAAGTKAQRGTTVRVVVAKTC